MERCEAGHARGGAGQTPAAHRRLGQRCEDAPVRGLRAPGTGSRRASSGDAVHRLRRRVAGPGEVGAGHSRVAGSTLSTANWARRAAPCAVRRPWRRGTRTTPGAAGSRCGPRRRGSPRRSGRLPDDGYQGLDSIRCLAVVSGPDIRRGRLRCPHDGRRRAERAEMDALVDGHYRAEEHGDWRRSSPASRPAPSTTSAAGRRAAAGGEEIGAFYRALLARQRAIGRFEPARRRYGTDRGDGPCGTPRPPGILIGARGRRRPARTRLPHVFQRSNA